ncbi:SIALI-17 repeat-containing surface protein [Streptococcus infantis]|uniref:SIALI-17 repeat-containing surface protein n=1 Tax=Streptococcus infantis TaxID=68892 RepID=UPI0030B80CDB
MPEFTGGVNVAEVAVYDIPEFKGGVNWVEAAKNEVPEFKGGANWVEAAKNELPEFKGGVNWVEAAKNDVPEYKETLGAGDNQTSPVAEKLDQKPALTPTPAMQAAQKEADQSKLPETGEGTTEHLFLAGLTLAMSALFLQKRKED